MLLVLDYALIAVAESIKAKKMEQLRVHRETLDKMNSRQTDLTSLDALALGSIAQKAREVREDMVRAHLHVENTKCKIAR